MRVWSPEETFMRFKVTNQPEGGDCDQTDPNCMFFETDYDLINATAWNTLYAPLILVMTLMHLRKCLQAYSNIPQTWG